MNSVVNPTPIHPHQVLSARVDDELTLAYQKIKSVDDEIARASEQLSRLERGDARRRPPRSRPALRGLIGLVLAAGIGAAAVVSQSSYGDTARQMIAGWAPLGLAMSSPSQAEPVLPVQPSPAAAQLAQAQPASPQPGPAAQAVAEAVAPTATTLQPELTELLQKMASDLAAVQQGIEQLKASQAQLKANQEQMSLDNVRVADEVKAGQEQMARLVAKTPDKIPDNAADRTAGRTTPDQAYARHTTPAPVPAPRPPAASARKPAPATPSPHAAVRRPAPVQLQSAQQ
jgi:hypothetical protein